MLNITISRKFKISCMPKVWMARCSPSWWKLSPCRKISNWHTGTSRRIKEAKTAGTDGKTIQHLEKLSEEKLVVLVQRKFSWYVPQSVRRVEIPKDNGKTRPLGIPTIMDRLVQQCVLQVLDPICEAKFHDHSYGFRPNRSQQHAISQVHKNMQLSHLHYVVDIDIKGLR